MMLCFSTIVITSCRGNPSSTVVSLEQYTPDKSDWSTFYSKAVDDHGKNTDHSPDGVFWIDNDEWKPWDGTTIYDPTQYTKKELAAEICPGHTVRGIYELFQETKPFQDNVNPTKAEVDYWHAIAINHVRAMVNYTEAEYQIKPDKCLHIRALWSTERQTTRKWDDTYPDGTCEDSSNPHCGAGFLPSKEDQQDYLPDGIESCGKKVGSEGLFSAAKSNIPWSIKWIRPFCATLGGEGFWGGHTGPWFGRTQFGFDWYDSSPDDFNSNAILRAKWSGTSGPSKYENPRITAGTFEIFREDVTPTPRFTAAECNDAGKKWFGQNTVHNATECYDRIMADEYCGKRFMTMNPGRELPGCACYPVDMTTCETRVDSGSRLTWDFESVSSSFDGLTVNISEPLWKGRACFDVIWKPEIKSGDAAHCLQKITENNFFGGECGRHFISFNTANGGCGCYPPERTTCERSETNGQNGRMTYQLGVDPSYYIPSDFDSDSGSPSTTPIVVCPTDFDPVWCEGNKYSNLCMAEAVGFLESQCTDDKPPVVVLTCEFDDSNKFLKKKKKKSCSKYVGKKSLKKRKKKCNKKLKKKEIHHWCPVTCGKKAGLGQCAFLKK